MSGEWREVPRPERSEIVVAAIVILVLVLFAVIA